MSWLATLPVILASAALLFVPGLAVAYGLGLRGLPAWAGAPIFTVTVSSLTAIAAGKLGIPWTVLPIIVVAAVLAAVSWGLRRALRSRFSTAADPWSFKPSRAAVGQWLGFAAGAAIIANQLRHVFGAPTNLSQTFDNIFHLNAVRYMLDTHSGSSMMIANMTNGGATPDFYPAAWHGLTAVVVQLSGAPISAAANMFNLVIAAAIWVLGAMILVRTALGPRPWAIAFAALLSASFSAFPLLLLDFGVLYPNFLAIAMLPFSLAAVVAFFGLGTEMQWHPVARYASAPLAAIGVAIAHPNGAMTLIALAIPVVLVAYGKRYLQGGLWRTRRIQTALATAGLVVAAVVVYKLWLILRPPAEASTWEPINRPAGSIGEILTNSAMHRPMALVVSILMLIGIYAAFRRGGHYWLLGCFAVTAFLFLVVSGYQVGDFRTLITGVWYNDSYRLAAILPVTALPLAALGFQFLGDKGCELLKGNALAAKVSTSLTPSSRALMGGAAGVLSLIILTVGMQGFSMTYAVASAAGNYKETANAPLVSTDEQRLLDKLDSLVPADAVIAVSPWTGASMAYALSDRKTTAKHTFDTSTPDVSLINNHLRDAESDPEVCPAVERTGVRYALDFGTLEVHGGHHDYPGLDNLQNSPAFELVAEVGKAKLFKLLAC